MILSAKERRMRLRSDGDVIGMEDVVIVENESQQSLLKKGHRKRQTGSSSWSSRWGSR
jgi:hypothetical protein